MISLTNTINKAVKAIEALKALEANPPSPLKGGLTRLMDSYLSAESEVNISHL
jgi:hypothetical protein